MAVSAPRGKVIAAFIAVYLIWGSTYLGIRFAIETIPPFLLSAVRFSLAGLILFTVAKVRGRPSPVNLRFSLSPTKY